MITMIFRHYRESLMGQHKYLLQYNVYCSTIYNLINYSEYLQNILDSQVYWVFNTGFIGPALGCNRRLTKNLYSSSTMKPMDIALIWRVNQFKLKLCVLCSFSCPFLINTIPEIINLEECPTHIWKESHNINIHRPLCLDFS